jgi:hypothetical protein
MLEERVLLGNGLQLFVSFVSQENWKLSLARDEKVLFEYSSATNTAFQSVEKLRYDFENDLRKGR